MIILWSDVFQRGHHDVSSIAQFEESYSGINAKHFFCRGVFHNASISEVVTKT